MQINLNIAKRIVIIFGFLFIFLPGKTVFAQDFSVTQEKRGITTRFIKPEIFPGLGDLNFNIVRIVNHADSAIRIKPILVMPPKWNLFSNPYNDTLVKAHDSISLIYRFKLPDKVSSEISYDLSFRAYSSKNNLLSENICKIYPEPRHDWNITMPENRVFFSPRNDQTGFSVKVENKGNVGETIDLKINIDKKIDLTSTGSWQPGQPLVLEPFQDTVLNFDLEYSNKANPVFDLSKFQIDASTEDTLLRKPLMIEKYSDTYAPFVIDRSLPHQIEVGFRTFSKNDKILPFIKTRGKATLNKQSTLAYNFNYYALTGNENFISNTYYNFLYSWKMLKVGLGAFSSPLGRNLYTRSGLMVNGIMKLSPTLQMEGYLSQSIIYPKTSVATGLTYQKKKIKLLGTLAYDIDNDKKVNTGSAMISSNVIPIFKNHEISFNLYGYHEVHSLTQKYTMAGVAYDLNYFIKIGKVVTLQFSNNYGSPNMPGTQMGVLNFFARSSFQLGKSRKIAVSYANTSRDYYSYSYEGVKLPTDRLYNQYSSLMFQSNKNIRHIWEAGPSVESFISYRSSAAYPEDQTEYRTQKLRMEYRGIILKSLTLNMKTGMSNILIIDSRETKDRKYDFHLMGGYSFPNGIAINFSYDYGPMVNSGLYQFAGDAKNHSLNFGPGIYQTYAKDRVAFNLFSNFTYRFDLKYGSININPKVEAYLFRDWYVVASGTYHYAQQQYPDIKTRNSYVYFEFSIKKRFGKSEFNKWQRGTRKLRVELFKDDNGNGQKDDNEKGVPDVKTRLTLTNTDDPEISTQFPIDITLLSNSKGMVYYNQLPTGFYDLNLVPLGDVREYFYVNKAIEKIQLTENDVHYIPFQKATKLTGKLIVERQKFIRKGTENLDLENIKITAYDNNENSYSAFTLEDGTFTIFVPGNNTYFLRMGNVFGSGFKILKNDIPVRVGDTVVEPVVFNIEEISRQVKFKDSKAAPADSVRQQPLKIKVLHGKFYENSNKVPVDKDAIPEFNIKEAPVPERPIISGNFYVVLGQDQNRTEAVKMIRILKENGIDAKLGYLDTENMYYVYSGYFATKAETRAELDRMRQAGLNEAESVKF